MSSKPLRKLIFTTQPSNVEEGAEFDPPVHLIVQHPDGGVDTEFHLQQAKIVLDHEPIPTELIVNQPPNSTPRRLRVVCPGCEDAVSDVYYVLRKTPQRRLVFKVSPTGTFSGWNLRPAPTVAAVDEQGNVDTSFTGEVTVEIDKEFPNEREGNRVAYRLRATSPGCVDAVSKIFYITD